MYSKIRDVLMYNKIEGEGIPILMIHGWGVDHRILYGSMEPIFKDIQGYKRYYIDLPGMGLTKHSEKINGSDDLIEYIEEYIKANFPNEKFLLVGNSYGGYLVRQLVKRMSEKIIGMLLIAPLFKPHMKTESGFDKGDVPNRRVIKVDNDFLNTLSDKERESFQYMAVCQTQKEWNLFREYILPSFEMANGDFLENNLGKNVPFTSDPDIFEKSFDKPSLIITGRQDAEVGYKGMLTLLDNYPRATFAVLDSCGHNLHIESIDVFRSLVLDWLERVEISKLINTIL